MSTDLDPSATTSTSDGEPPARSPRLRRGPGSDDWLITLLALALALAIGGVLMAATSSVVHSDLGYFFQHPADTFRDSWKTVRGAYTALFEGSIYNPGSSPTASGRLGPIANTVYTAAPLICGGLGVSLAFRTGLFNIGGQGQVIAGALASAYVGFGINLPIGVHLVAAVLAGIAAGSLWGMLAGFLKTRFGAHEVITTIMLNYIALDGLAFLLQTRAVRSAANPQTSRTIPGSARLPHLLGATLPVDLGIVLALVAAITVWWLLQHTALGLRLRAMGANPAAARTAGMNVPVLTMTAMALSGALTGLAGTLLSLGGATQYVVTPQIDNNVGFDAITVALLGRRSPRGVVAAGLLIGAMRAGAPTMQAQTSVPPDIVTIIQALVVIFVAAPRLTRSLFRLHGRGRALRTGVATNLSVTVATVRKTRVPRHVSSGAAQILCGILSLWIFGLSARSRYAAVFHFSLPGARFDLGTWSVQARIVIVVLSALVIGVGVLRSTKRLAGKWCAAIAIAGLLVSFMTWSIAGDLSGINIVSLLQGALFPSAIPLILGSLAGVIGERSGVVNVALEGQLLLGAFAAAIVGSVTHNVWAGLLGGAFAGVLVAAALTVLAIRYLVDQVIVAVVLNVLVLGVTNFLFTEFVSANASSYNAPSYFHIWKVPLLGDIPIIGPVLFGGTLFLYFAYAAVAGTSFALFHTRWGLRLRAVGEHPRAADTVGIRVQATRYRAMLLAGIVAGLAGAFLVLGEGHAGTFSENISSGRGYIALAAVIFGRWTPRGALLAALLFGFADQLQSLLAQASAPVNPNLLLMAPYIATLVAVTGFVGRVRAPAADGQPYLAG